MSTSILYHTFEMRGYNYIRTEYENGATIFHVVYVAEGRDGKALRKFWKRLQRMGIKIKAFALDMWTPYIAAIRERFSRAKLVFDRYHIMAQYGRLLDELKTRRICPGEQNTLLRS